MNDPLLVILTTLAHCRTIAVENAPLLLGLFLTGLVGSASHCAVMCGPFVLTQSAAVMSQTSLGTSELRRMRGAALMPYHFGRVITYVMLGTLLALPLQVMERAAQFRFVPALALAAAALLFVVIAIGGLGRLNYVPGFAAALGARLAGLARPLFANPTGWRGLLIGLLLGFLPCGLLYAAVGAAIAPADALIAAMGMAAFTVGTFPMLWLVAYLGVAAQRRWAGIARQALPVVAVFNAIVLGWMAWRWFGA